MLSVENIATAQDTLSVHKHLNELRDDIYKLTLRILVAEKKNSDLARRIDDFNKRSSQKI